MSANKPLWAGLHLDKMASASGFDTTPEVADALLALAREQRDLLRSLEWSGGMEVDLGEFELGLCPTCYDKPHAPDCRLAALLDTEHQS